MKYKIYSTKYFGIHVQLENSNYWIFDDNGGDLSTGSTYPTNSQIDEYRNNVIV